MKNTANMIKVRNNVFFSQWWDVRTVQLYLQRKRLPDKRNTPETRQLREQYISNGFDTVKTITWIKKQYNWRLREAVQYFKAQFGIKEYSELHPLK